jgi:hypothetical protein
LGHPTGRGKWPRYSSRTGTHTHVEAPHVDGVGVVVTGVCLWVELLRGHVGRCTNIGRAGVEPCKFVGLGGRRGEVGESSHVILKRKSKLSYILL